MDASRLQHGDAPEVASALCLHLVAYGSPTACMPGSRFDNHQHPRALCRMPRGIPIDPPILVHEISGTPTRLSTVEQVIDYVQRRRNDQGWEKLRDAAFIAAAVPSSENIEAMREIALVVFG